MGSRRQSPRIVSREGQGGLESAKPTVGRKTKRHEWLPFLTFHSLAYSYHEGKYWNHILPHRNAIFQPTGNPGWLEGTFPALVVLKYNMETRGAPSVILTSLWRRPACCAGNYSAALWFPSWGELTLEKEVDRSGLKNSSVRGTSPTFHSAQ